MATQRGVLTIGHSDHTIERLIELLGQHHVTAVADVRSSPYSQMNAQFNREALASALKQAGIAYSFLGKELGGRPADRPSPYSQMNPQFNRKALPSALKQAAIAFSFLGKELGGRPADKTCYENGRVQYRRVAATPIFRSGQ